MIFNFYKSNKDYIQIKQTDDYKVYKVHKVYKVYRPCGRLVYGSKAADKYCPKDTRYFMNFMNLMN